MAFDHRLAQKLMRPMLLRLWMVKNLPMGVVSGMVIADLNEESCKVELKAHWWIRNPFKSVFWAVMGMAAELSTGALLHAYCSDLGVRFILVEMTAKFYKKTKGKSFYFCQAGQRIQKNLNEMQNANESRVLILPAQAQNRSGEILADFEFYWQLRKTN